VTLRGKKISLPAKSEERFRNVQHRVGNLENESLRDGKEIERLKKEDASCRRVNIGPDGESILAVG
jgi:hypothetical protein